MPKAIAEDRRADTVAGDHSGPIIDSVNGHGIIDCAVCGFPHVLPLPDPAALEEEYRRAYYEEEKPDYLAHAREDEEWADLQHDDRLQVIESTLLRPRPEEGYRLLEIGSGPGFFLKSAGARGYRAMGIEPSLEAAAHAREMGLEVVEGFFNAENAARLGRFDVIYMCNVLEHVPNPGELVGLAHGLLEPGGVICVSVPNDYSPFQKALREVKGFDPWWVAPPHHLNYFDFASLSLVLVRAGFDIAERYTSFPMDLFLMLGEDYVGHPRKGRACHGKRKDFDLTLEKADLGPVRRAFYNALAEAGIGREAILIAVKPDAPSEADERPTP